MIIIIIIILNYNICTVPHSTAVRVASQSESAADSAAAVTDPSPSTEFLTAVEFSDLGGSVTPSVLRTVPAG